MKTVCTILVSAFLLASTVQAQDVMPVYGAGAKAVLFSFSGLATLGAGTFDGGVGGKYYLSDEMAVRGGLQFASASQDVAANPNPGQTGTDGSLSASRIGVSAAVELHMTKKRVSPYIGGGVMFSTTSTESKSVEVGAPPATPTTTKNDVSGEVVNGSFYQGASTFTVFGMLGVEFFLYNEMSLSAEYRIGFSSSSRPDMEMSNGTVTVTQKVGGGSTIGFSTGGALTLAVYL